MCDYRAAERYNVTAHQKQVHLGIKRVAKKYNVDKSTNQVHENQMPHIQPPQLQLKAPVNPV